MHNILQKIEYRMEVDMRPQKPISEEENKKLQQFLKETKTKSDFRRVQCVVLRAELGLTSPTR